MDTPARAKRAPRPHTRAWKYMLSEATEQSREAAEIRTRLRSHLAAADRLASKRVEKAKLAAKQSGTQASKSIDPAQPAESHQQIASEVDHSQHPLFVLSSLSTVWTQRVQALVRLRTVPKQYDLQPVIPWLALQLSDMRSKVVSAASVTVGIVATAGCLSADQAALLFTSAALGTNVTKQVMADARRSAALSCLHGQQDQQLFDKVADVACNTDHHAIKKVVLDALVEVTNCAKDVRLVAGAVQKILSKTATDKHSQVRAGARSLKSKFEDRFGESEWRKILDGMPADAADRLQDSGEKEGSGADHGKPKARMTMKEIIRQKREELRRQKALVEDGEKLGHKRSSEVVDFGDRQGGNKKGALARVEKENLPAES